MENINGMLCISHAELINGIATIPTIKKWQRDKKVTQLQRGGNGAEAMFVVDSLPAKYKQETGIPHFLWLTILCKCRHCKKYCINRDPNLSTRISIYTIFFTVPEITM